MSSAFLIVGYITSILGWWSSAYYGDGKLDLQLAGVGIYVAGILLKFGCGL